MERAARLGKGTIVELVHIEFDHRGIIRLGHVVMRLVTISYRLALYTAACEHPI